MHQPVDLDNVIELSESTREAHRLRLIEKGKHKFPNPYQHDKTGELICTSVR